MNGNPQADQTSPVAKVLRQLEWSRWSESHQICPVCQSTLKYGHTPDCELDKAIKHVDDMEKCLAGMMLCGALNGVYLTEDMTDWGKSVLKNEKRTPAQLWNLLFSKEKS